MAGLCSRCMCNVLRNCQTACQIKTSLVVYERPSCSTSSPMFHAVGLLNFNHPCGHVVAFHSGFNLCFPNGLLCALLAIPLSSVAKCLFQVFLFFVFVLFCFYKLRYLLLLQRNSYILDTNPLSDIRTENVLSQSRTGLFIFLFFLVSTSF